MDLVDDIWSGERQKIIIPLQILGVILELVVIPIVVTTKFGRFSEVFLLKRFEVNSRSLSWDEARKHANSY